MNRPNLFKRMPRNVVILSFVSMLNDISSESIARILPIFLRESFKASFVAIGWIEGLADSLSIILRLVSGWLADRFQKKKPLIVFGYGLSALIRPFFPFAIFTFGWMGALFLKALDRVGKAVRIAPRDVLIAQESQKDQRGASFGLNRALDTSGALIGIALAAVIIHYKETIIGGAETISFSLFKTLIFTASIFGFGAVALILWGVQEKVLDKEAQELKKVAWAKTSLKQIPKPFYYYLVCVCLFSLSGSSDAFLILKLRAAGFSLSATLLLILGYNVIAASTVYPLSRYSDLIKQRKILIVTGWVIYTLSYLLFGLSSTPLYLGLGFVTYGLYYGFVESTEKALVADLVPSTHLGRAYGIFHFFTGFMLLPANLVFGLISDTYGLDKAFQISAGISFLAAFLLMFARAGRSKEENAF